MNVIHATENGKKTYWDLALNATKTGVHNYLDRLDVDRTLN